MAESVAELSASAHPTHGRRRKFKGPALPDLPSVPDGLDSSGGGEAENEVKRPRSISTSPRSGSARGLEPCEYDRWIFSEDIGDGEGTDVSLMVLRESSRGMGSASFLQVLNSNRMARLEILAACASQAQWSF